MSQAREQESKPSARILAVLAFIGAMGVALGAFGAHALRAVVEPRLLDTWQTAVFYLMVHALAGLLLEWMLPGRRLGLMMCVGIALFSGSLFLLVGTGIGALGAVTPFGGVVFIVAWLSAVRAFFQARRESR